MFRSEGDRRLYRLFGARAEARPEHKKELEAALLSRFDRTGFKGERARMRMVKSVVFKRVMAISAAFVIVCVGACVAPADVDVEVGRSMDIRYDSSSEGSPDPRDVVEAVRAQGAIEDMGVRVRREGQSVVIHLDVWGTGLPEGPLADRVRKAIPALAGATIEEGLLEGKVRGTVGEKLGHDLLDLDVVDSADVEEVKRQIMARLAASGVEGEVEVKVEDDGSKKKVMIKVEKRDCDPPEASARPADGPPLQVEIKGADR